MSVDSQTEASITGSSVVRASKLARQAPTRATVVNLARAVDEQQVEIRGMKYWLLQKATYNCSVSDTLNTKLDQISL